MVYTPQTWTNGQSGGTPLSAARLTVIENGVAAAAIRAEGNTFTLPQMVDGTTDAIQLRVQHVAAGTASLQTWENSSATVLASVSAAGLGSFAGVTTTGFKTAYAAKTTTYTVTTADHVIDCTSGTFTVTLPTAVSDAGRTFVIKNTGTGVVTVDASGAQLIDGLSAQTLATQYQSFTLVSNGTDWVII